MAKRLKKTRATTIKERGLWRAIINNPTICRTHPTKKYRTNKDYVYRGCAINAAEKAAKLLGWKLAWHVLQEE